MSSALVGGSEFARFFNWMCLKGAYRFDSELTLKDEKKSSLTSS